jgi:hypothetical protein
VTFSLNIHKISEASQLIDNIERVSFCSELGHGEILTGHEDFFSLITELKYNASNGSSQAIQMTHGFLSFSEGLCEAWID